LQGILSALRAGSSALQLPEAVIEKIQKNIAVSMDLLHERQGNTYSQFELATQMTAQSQAEEHNLEDELARRMKNNLKFKI